MTLHTTILANQVVAFAGFNGKQQICAVINREHLNQCLTIYVVCNSWCEHRVIAKRIKTLSVEDLNASGQNSLNLVQIRYIPTKGDMQGYGKWERWVLL